MFEERSHANSPEQLPGPNPWEFLLSIESIPRQLRNIFLAAQSRIYAFRHLCGIPILRATRKTDWNQKLVEAYKAQNSAAFDKAMAKVADGMLLSGMATPSRAVSCDPFEILLKERRRHLVKRGKSKLIKSVAPEASLDAIRHFAEYKLIETWVCFYHYELPGLMFWSNRAITAYLLTRLHANASNYGNRGLDFVKTMRQEIGLVPADDKKPIISKANFTHCSDGTEVKLYARNSKVLFRGKFQFLDDFHRGSGAHF